MNLLTRIREAQDRARTHVAEKGPARRREAALFDGIVMEILLFVFLYYAFDWELLAAGKVAFAAAIFTYLYSYGFTYAPAACRCAVERQWRSGGGR